MKKDKDQFIIGIHPVMEALKAGKELNKVFLKKGSESGHFTELFQALRKNNVPYQFVPVEKLNRMSRANHQGIIAIYSTVEYKNLEEIVQHCYEEGKDPFIIVLDQLTDVRNFGAIARTSECAGVDAIVIPSKGSVSITPDAIKTSAGALNRISVCRSENIHHTVNYLKESGLMIIAATEKADNYYFSVDLKGPISLIMGSEETGISSTLLRLACKTIKIPLSGKIESLNVSVACGIITYEIVRQRMSPL